jgi:hypothetical protein
LYEVRSPARLEDFESFIVFLRGTNSIIPAQMNLSSISSLSEEFSVSSLLCSFDSFRMCTSLLVLAGGFSSLESEVSTMSDSFSQLLDRLSSIEDRCSSTSLELNELEQPLDVQYPLVPLFTSDYVNMI